MLVFLIFEICIEEYKKYGITVRKRKEGKDDDSSRIFRTRSNIYKYGGESFFPEAEHVPYRTIPDCMDAAANGNVAYAVVPLENAIEGSVNITVDYLVHEQPLSIVGEITVPIQQHLLVHPQYAEVWEEVYAVHSHPHAIAQCHKF